MQIDSQTDGKDYFTNQESEAIKEIENKIYDEISNGEGDYLNLPQYGAEYFSLSDAALILAVDEWWQKSHEDEPDFYEGVCHPQARSESLPLRKLITQSLVQAVKNKDLEAIVCLRTFPNGDPSPDRTYAHVAKIQKYMESYGLGRGHLFEWAQQLDDEVFDLAVSVSRRRAHIEYGFIPESQQTPTGKSPELIKDLLDKVSAQKLRIVYLEKRKSGDEIEERSLGERKKNNLYRTIGALLELLLPLYKDKQEALIADIEEKFGKQDGLSERTLQSVFPMARRMLRTDRR